MISLTGLSNAEVLARRGRGQGNNVKFATSRSYRDILSSNILNTINIILFTIGALMIAIGRASDAIATVGLILFNIVIGVVQEIRAKRQLDHIALLTRPKISVMRENREVQVDPSELVLGDLIVVRAGDQMVVDGIVVGDGKMSVDESLISGESDTVHKAAGDRVLSGSFCVSGGGMFEATQVGNDSYANRITANARKFQLSRTPLQREIAFVLRLIVLLAIFIGGIQLIGTIISKVPLMRQVQMAAVIAGLVPNGLFFMVILAYAIGALRIARCGALVQQANAVESLSNVTLLCTDKTGTLTTNRIVYDSMYPVGISRTDLEARLGSFARSSTTVNKTAQALIDALAGARQAAADEVPFSSSLKWSGLTFHDGPYRGAQVLGAPEILRDHLNGDEGAWQQLQAWSEQGLRVLAFGHNPNVVSLHDGKDEPCLPPLELIGLVSLRDQLRPNLQEVVANFSRAGVQLKIISGDNPHAVASLARQAGFGGPLRSVSGIELAAMDEGQFEQAARENNVFGRITPEQKEKLVEVLRGEGHYVAMIGDGVNDALSLKKADMGIAMESGSAVTRGVADMILIGDSFEALPLAFREGQRIVNGMRDILRLFLTRVLYSALLILAIATMGLGFPFVPKHNTLLVFLTVGAPTLGLALWAHPAPVSHRSLLREIAHFVLPAAGTIFFFGLIVYIASFYLGTAQVVRYNITPDAIANFQRTTGIDYDISTPSAYVLEVSQLAAQTALTTFIVLAGLLLVVFVEPPFPWFAGGDPYIGDRRPAALAVALMLAFAVILIVPPLRSAFELIPLEWWQYLLIAGTTILWGLVLRFAWRRRLLEHYLDLEL